MTLTALSMEDYKSCCYIPRTYTLQKNVHNKNA